MASAASFDFAFFTGLANAPLLGELLSDLHRDFGRDLGGIELYGRKATGEVIALIRFPNSPFSLSWKLRRDGERLNGRFFEHSRMSDEEKAAFERELTAAEIHQSVGGDPRTD